MPFSPLFMSTFQETLRHAEDWLKPLSATLACDIQRAYHGLRAVLQTLRDRLTVDESAHLASHMPMLIRGIFYEGFTPTGKPIKMKNREEFYTTILRQFDLNDPIAVEALVRAVFAVLAAKVPAGEIKDVIHNLPNDLRELWPTTA